MFVVRGPLLLHGRQRLLSLAQGPLHLLQLPGQGFVTLLQLRVRLCVLVWKERQERMLELFCCGEKLQWTNMDQGATAAQHAATF